MRYFKHSHERQYALSEQWYQISRVLTHSQCDRLMTMSTTLESRAHNLHKVTKSKQILAKGEELLRISRLPLMRLIAS